MSTQISGSGVITPTLDLTTPLAQADGGTINCMYEGYL